MKAIENAVPSITMEVDEEDTSYQKGDFIHFAIYEHGEFKYLIGRKVIDLKREPEHVANGSCVLTLA
jgi:hypothetical protein